MGGGVDGLVQPEVRQVRVVVHVGEDAVLVREAAVRPAALEVGRRPRQQICGGGGGRFFLVIQNFHVR